jgi:hypothetical protein
MKKISFLIPVLAGAIFGQVFAEGESPVSVINTVRVGYDDNPYRNARKDGSLFIEDVLDVAFRAALSERTDFMTKMQLRLDSDDREKGFYPNIYGKLSHSVSSRLLLQLSDTLKTGSRNGDVGNSDDRVDYWRNTTELTADYILNDKTRLGASVGHTEEDDDPGANRFDFSRNDFGVSVSRELQPQQTSLGLYYYRSLVNYDENPDYDMDSVYAQLTHTFSPEWNAYVLGGATRTDRTANKKDSTDPKVGVGIAFLPSPRTEISADVSVSHAQTDNTNYGGQDDREIRFGVRHDLTGRITLTSTLSYRNSQYDTQDYTGTGTARDTEDDRYDWDTRLRYKLNRMHSLEAGYKYARKESDTTDNWTQNRVDLGWRVEF